MAAYCKTRFSVGGNLSRRAASRSCTLGGTSTSSTGRVSTQPASVRRSTPSSISARKISSTKKGLPCARSTTRWTTSGGTCSRKRAVTSARLWSGSRGRRPTYRCGDCFRRSRKAFRRSSAWASSGGRLRSNTSARPSAVSPSSTVRNRCSRNRDESTSAQCRSSTTRTRGWWAEARRKSCSSESMMRSRRCSGVRVSSGFSGSPIPRTLARDPRRKRCSTLSAAGSSTANWRWRLASRVCSSPSSGSSRSPRTNSATRW